MAGVCKEHCSQTCNHIGVQGEWKTKQNKEHQMQDLIPVCPEIHDIAGEVPTLLFSLAEYQNKEINNMGKRV